MSSRRRCFTMIELIVVVAIIAVLIALLLPAVHSAREGARRTQCVNNLLQLGVALATYEATYQVLPPGTVDKTGPIVEDINSYQFGWIPRILPYLEQKAVYRALDFKTGVYQAANLTAGAVSMNVLTCPSDPKRWNGRGWSRIPGGMSTGFNPLAIPDPTTTAFAACHNDTEAPIDVTNTGVFYLNSRVRLDDIEDGLSHTIFLGEKKGPGDELGWPSGTRATLRNTGTPINRTVLDPTDLSGFHIQLAKLLEPPDPTREPVDPALAAPTALPGPVAVGGFGSFHPQGANFLLGDGSARFLKSTIDREVFRRLGSRADGLPVGDDRF